MQEAKMGFSDVYRSVLKDYPDVLTVEEMSRALGISTKTGYKLIRENKIESLKVGRSYRIPKAHLLSYGYRKYPLPTFHLAWMPGSFD